MGRFILRYRGRKAAPAADLDRLTATPGLVILDEASPRMLLVDGPEDALRRLLETMPDWVLAPESAVPLPDVRRRPRSAGGRR